jgi:hypothetical protein
VPQPLSDLQDAQHSIVWIKHLAIDGLRHPQFDTFPMHLCPSQPALSILAHEAISA